MTPSVVLCAACVLRRFSFRELITAAALNPFARDCRAARLHVGAVLAAVFAIAAGCCSTATVPDLATVRQLRQEIASMGSMAKIQGPRDDKERARIDHDVSVALVHVDEIAPAWSGR